jgi:hypothetical protein
MRTTLPFQPRNFPVFMAPESPLPLSQMPTICPYSELVQTMSVVHFYISNTGEVPEFNQVPRHKEVPSLIRLFNDAVSIETTTMLVY